MAVPPHCNAEKKEFWVLGPRPEWLGKHTQLTPLKAPRPTPGRKSTQTGQTPTRYPPGACAGRKKSNFVLRQASYPNPGSTTRDHPASSLAGPHALLAPLQLVPYVDLRVPHRSTSEKRQAERFATHLLAYPLAHMPQPLLRSPEGRFPPTSFDAHHPRPQVGSW